LVNETSSNDEIYGQIMTEYWIEPQMGTARTKNPSAGYLEGKDFREIGDAVSNLTLHLFVHSLHVFVSCFSLTLLVC